MSNCITSEVERFAEIFNALSNPNRLQIYTLLSGCCVPGTTCAVETLADSCVGEIGEQLNIAPSTLSHHLRELSQAGLITMSRQGKQVMCAVNPDMLVQIQTFFNHQAAR